MREEEAAVAGPIETTDRYKVVIKEINAWFGRKQALKNINLNIKDKSVTAFIGPSGCGKTTSDSMSQSYARNDSQCSSRRSSVG